MLLMLHRRYIRIGKNSSTEQQFSVKNETSHCSKLSAVMKFMDSRILKAPKGKPSIFMETSLIGSLHLFSVQFHIPSFISHFLTPKTKAQENILSVVREG
jgi:hypothetical protein